VAAVPRGDGPRARWLRVAIDKHSPPSTWRTRTDGFHAETQRRRGDDISLSDISCGAGGCFDKLSAASASARNRCGFQGK
jgi:hypothetical protein